MKAITKILLILAAGSVMTSTIPALGEARGFYIQGDVGGNITEDIDLKEFFGPVAPGSKVKLDPGLRLGVTGGYQVNDWFAGEVELGVVANTIDSITGATRVHDATFVNVPFLVNAKFQYQNKTPFTPFIGAGVGFSESIFDVDSVTLNNITLSGDDAVAVFAYQAFAGLRYRLNEKMGLSLEYRYFATDSPHWHADVSFGTASDTLSFGGSHTHSISLAFDFRF
ncbi:MAG TPA: OmpW family outer membrane protein [Candidatus Limnocylindrales bacterium]|jgi:opacity protein-like surface antigen|nr:OmpW family outer membrane protein [Candidatus Limnocylindrales bacterium]